ncbi:hypothetical protein LCGC14_2007200, partial [marine sediment metagenome]
VLTGFASRYAEPESQTITIVKDNLKAVPARDFNLGIEYGAVYTIKRPDSWEIIYNGTIVNSLHEPVPVKNLTLYFEDFDEFVEIATIDTDENSNFYFNYTKYGNIEQNPLVRIMYKGDGLYNPLDHIEYGGIEMGADQNWWFYDEDGDGWPEWPFTLYDLFAALQIESSPTTSDLSVYLAWMAEFNENSGTSTFDIVSNLEGLLKGNTSWTSGRRDSGLLFDGDGIITPPQSTGFVKSVQYKELVFSTSDVTKSIALDVGTNISNTIPFVTIKENVGDDWDDIMVDVYFTDSPATVYAQRSTSGATITVSIFIVEFDDVKVKVQSGTFSNTGTFAEETISQINTSKAIPMAYYKASGGDDDWDASMVTTDFTDTTTIRMERHGSSGTMSGHYYVFEAQDSEFSVQKAVLSMSSSQGYDTASINSVNMSKSFIVSSYESDRANDDPEDGALDVFLNSATEVRAERHSETSYFNGFPTINVFVITFTGAESVQRGDFTWANSDTFKETDITAVDLGSSMIKSGNMYGIMQSDGTGSSDVKSAFVQHEFVDTDTIRLERYTNNEDGKGHWEVIEWELMSSSPAVYEDFDYLLWNDILDNVFGNTSNQFVVTSWIYPTALTSNQSSNNVKNVFFSKDGMIEIGINESGYLELFLSTDLVQTTARYGIEGLIQTNEFTYIAIRYNESDVDIFIDDFWYRSAVGSIGEPWSGSVNITSGGDLIIGAELIKYSSFTGKLDDIS